jgi:hypothetical protein
LSSFPSSIQLVSRLTTVDCFLLNLWSSLFQVSLQPNLIEYSSHI